MSVIIDGLGDVAWGDLFPRKKLIGDGEAYLGGEFVVTITRPFTESEDDIFRWVVAQDGVKMYGVVPLGDGRDLILFERSHTTQTRIEAEREHRVHIQRLVAAGRIRVPMQHDSSDTRER